MKQFDKKSVSPDLYSRNTLISYLVEKLLNGQYHNKKCKLLDVGGYGANLHHYVEQIDEFTILEKKAKPAQLDENIKYVEGSILKAPFSDRAFDVVVSTDMIEHLDKPDRPPAVRELLRVAKKYLILGMPCKNDLTENAERIVNEMFATVTGKNHEFLNEHIQYGLPKEERIEQVIKDMNLPYFKINEGNLMNWYIQYLYTSSQMDQLHNEKQFEFNRFYNENLFRLGNLRAPTYRTFFVVANDGYFSQEEIMSELADQWKWDPQAFMELLKKAFQDMRISMNRGAKLLQVQNQLTNLQVEYEKEHAHFEHTKKQLIEKDQIIQKARASMSVYKETIAEARDVLTARE
ncbi:methyltransferase domain-containing protein, partial [Candidatus Peregrinibacteria bacterium]|nr:methyltransferase domain-containing protein [Candidatus Peregrinibacteria bacterium]